MEVDGPGRQSRNIKGDRRKVHQKAIGRADVLCCVGVLILGLVAGDRHRTEQKPQFLVFPPETGTNYCTLIRTVDGDSVHLGLVIDISTRLYGIDTPERGQEGFKEATDRLQYLLSQNEYTRVEWRGRGKYGRCLATLYTNDETEVSINEMLVNEGHAKVYLP